MKFEPDENTLFETDAPRQPIFVIKISAIPSVIYLALLGLSVMAAIHASANPENEWLSALFPIALILWSVFLALSFLSVVALFVSRIHLYPDALHIRGIFRWDIVGTSSFATSNRSQHRYHATTKNIMSLEHFTFVQINEVSSSLGFTIPSPLEKRLMPLENGSNKSAHD